MKVNHHLLILVLAVMLHGVSVTAQTYNSGSNGSDGALDFTGQTGSIVFDPSTFNPPLDPDHDNVYHFTTIKIPANFTIRLKANVLGTKPVIWLASGAVTIAGNVYLIGDNGQGFPASGIPAVAGAGGYSGGTAATEFQTWTMGQGPGAARAAGGGAGHAVAGEGAPAGLEGKPYGNDFLLPIVGGSGGAGGTYPGGSGGGAGGGAIVIASSVSISLTGSIEANGGDAGGAVGSTVAGGGGSGGSIRLIAPVVDTNSSAILKARGGIGYSFNNTGRGSYGRIRLEAFQKRIAGTIDPVPRIASPGPVFPPASAPSVRITSIGGVAVPANPTASFITPDVTLDNAASVTIQLAASKVPAGTVVHLTLTPETGAVLNVDSTPLAGTFESSTATATVAIPHGFSRFSVQASWTP